MTASSDSLESLIEKARGLLGVLPAEALQTADRAVEIARRQGWTLLCAAAARVRGQALRHLGRHAEALEAFDAAADCARQLGDTRLAAQVQIGKIDSLGWLGDYEEGIRLARRLAEELRALGAEEEAAKALCNAGNLHFRRDQYAAALECYQEAQEVFARHGNIVAEGFALGNCANILIQLNRVEEALAQYARARAMFAQRDLALEVANADLNVGYLHCVSGRHAAAIAALNRARQTFAERGQEMAAAECDLDLGDAYRALNLHPEALERYERAVMAFASVAVEKRARAELGRAAVLMSLERYAEAEAALARAEPIFRQQKNAVQRAHVRLMRAYLQRAEGHSAEAQAEAWRAARALARRGLHGWAAEARHLLADLALEQGVDATRSMLSVSRTAQRNARGWLEARAQRALGRYYAQQGDVRRALRHFRAAMAALEAARTLIAPEEMHVAFLRDKLTVYEDLVETLLARGRQQDIAEALECVERAKSRLLLERVQSALEGRSTPESGRTMLNTRLAALRAALSREYHRLHHLPEETPQRLAGGVAGTVSDLAALERDYREALREMEMAESRSASGLFALSTCIAVEALQAALEPEEILLVFYIVRDTVCAFRLTRRDLRAFRGLAQLADVNGAARRLRYHLQSFEMTGGHAQRHVGALRVGIDGALQRLYDLLLRPLEADLPTEKVVLVPHGPLHALPFHAFSDGVQHALDRWEIVYAPSAALWHAVRRTEERTVPRSAVPPFLPSLLMGVPAPGIERVAEEVEQLARILPDCRVYCAGDATVEAFRVWAGHSRLIHLATHALYRADNPLFSGLRFVDGWLLARDLYEMRLECDLVTLSACHTGASRVESGDELFGMVRGFLAAGARSVVASLWPADDAATAMLMTDFYANLARGRPRAEALRAAQRRARQCYAHPYYWAAFTLIGERGPLA